MTVNKLQCVRYAALLLLGAAGCASIIGIDGDYVEGDPNPTAGGAGGAVNAGGYGNAGAANTTAGGGGNLAGGTGGVSSGGGAGATNAGGGGAATVGLPCNNETCAGGEVCCVAESDQNQSSCADPGSCPQQSFEVQCHGPADCPGQICCGRWSGSTYFEVNCADSCGTSGPGTGVVICSGDPSVCEAYQNCVPSNNLPQGYSYCG